MRERERFVVLCGLPGANKAELCREFGISEKTGHKWLRRFEQEGLSGLAERSRRPKHHPDAYPEEIRQLYIEARRKTGWGARKLKVLVERDHPDLEKPSAASISRWLKEAGLVESRSRRRRKRHRGTRPDTATPNTVWSVDFKGQFRMGNRRYCFPLTVADYASRYLIGCSGQRSTRLAPARRVFEQIFREFGLPEVILSDNGIPFAAPNSPLGLTRLSVWWIQLGIDPVRIDPGHPEQNGRHERMHRTLKDATARPPGRDLDDQQRRFDAFREDYNTVRPHEALEMEVPADRYRPSPRAYPPSLPEPDYPGHFEVRKVSSSGTFRLHNIPIFTSLALDGQYLGMEEKHHDIWKVFLYRTPLGFLDLRDRDHPEFHPYGTFGAAPPLGEEGEETCDTHTTTAQ